MTVVWCAGQVGAGLRENFNAAARGLTVVLLDKMKDKNRAVVEAVHCALDQFLLVRFQTCSFSTVPSFACS
jgi:hypothetical protein